MIVTNPFTPTGDVREISRGWWALLATGIMSAIAGGIILTVDWELDDLAVFIGAFLVFRGLSTMFTLPVDGSGRGWAIAVGLLEAGIGLMVWVWPAPTLLVVAFAIGWYVMFSGMTTIAGAIVGRDELPYWGWLLVFGIIEVGFSFWLLARPELTLVAAVLALGLWCVLHGAMLIVLAFELKRTGDKAERVEHNLNEMATTRDMHEAVR